MTWLVILVAFVVLVIAAGGVLVQFAGLPGTWIILLVVAAERLLEAFVPMGPPGSEPLFSWWTIVALAGIAIVAELVEFLAAAAGAKSGGASKRGMGGAVVGGLLGAVFGTFLIPIPVFGSIAGAAIGAALGAITGELSVGGKQLSETLKPAAGAVAGRLLGTLAKTLFAAAMWLWVAIACFA